MRVWSIQVLARVETHGVRVDADMLLQQSAEISTRLQEIERDAHMAAGEEFNIASPKQIQHILFEKLKLPIIKKTPKGQPSTAEDVLQRLVEGRNQGFDSFVKFDPRRPFELEFEVSASAGKVYGVTLDGRNLGGKQQYVQPPDQEFDLVVTDQTMPRMTGIELSCELLQVRANLPVILYTGYGEELSDEKLRECGIRGVLKKPVDIGELCSLINDLLCLARQ